MKDIMPPGSSVLVVSGDGGDQSPRPCRAGHPPGPARLLL